MIIRFIYITYVNEIWKRDLIKQKLIFRYSQEYAPELILWQRKCLAVFLLSQHIFYYFPFQNVLDPENFQIASRT